MNERRDKNRFIDAFVPAGQEKLHRYGTAHAVSDQVQGLFEPFSTVTDHVIQRIGVESEIADGGRRARREPVPRKVKKDNSVTLFQQMAHGMLEIAAVLQVPVHHYHRCMIIFRKEYMRRQCESAVPEQAEMVADRGKIQPVVLEVCLLGIVRHRNARQINSFQSFLYDRNRGFDGKHIHYYTLEAR
jgi:hypothetical protein